ncbi:hypothetical protein K8R66_01965 [bacterium]|nr:hypothetical protein [bacterium]
MKKNSGNLKLWRLITYLWGSFTALFFILDFFNILDPGNSLKTIVIIYISTLSIFTSIKELNRWKSKEFFSKYKGEIFVIIYTIITIIFISLSIIKPQQYSVPSEFTTAYLSILGIFAISSESKRLRRK